jgi:hypothetical protein
VVVIFKKIVLADSVSGIYAERFSFDARRGIETAEFPDAAEIEIFDRLNNAKSLAFEATREHATEDAAELWAATHDEEALGQGTLMLRGTFQGWERFFQDAACSNVSSYTEGCRTFTAYQLVMGLSSKKKPKA